MLTRSELIDALRPLTEDKEQPVDVYDDMNYLCGVATGERDKIKYIHVRTWAALSQDLKDAILFYDLVYTVKDRDGNMTPLGANSI